MEMDDQEVREIALMNKIRIDVARGVIEQVETLLWGDGYIGPSFTERRKVLRALEKWSDTLEYTLQDAVATG